MLELKLDRSTFLGALSKAQGVVDKKSTVNVLSHLLLASTDGGLQMVGTDYDVVVQAQVAGEVLQAGTACVNGKSLFDVVKSLDDASIRLSIQPNHWAEVTAGRSRFKLAGIPASDFPDVTTPSEVTWIGIPRGTLKDLIEKTAFSISDDETRMNLNGVFLKVGAGSEEGLARLTAVSTDGHRLSKVELETEAQGYDGKPHEAIVHKKGVQELRRLLDDDQSVVEVGFARGQILFRASGTTFTVRQIEGNYPEYQRVIPASSPIKITVDRQRMLSAIRRIAILTSNKTYIIKLELQPGRLAFTTSNPDYGEGRDELDVDYDGEGMVIGFNYTYLLDVLNVIRGETAVLEFSDEYGASVLSSPAEPGALFVVMPMRI